MIYRPIQLVAALFSQMVLVSATTYECAKPFDQQVWLFQNMMRTNPTDFVPFLEYMKFKFSGQEYQTVEGKSILTEEGTSAVEELI